MRKNLVFPICLSICFQIVSAQRSPNGYLYNKPFVPQIVDLPGTGPHPVYPQIQKENEFHQQLRPPLPLPHKQPTAFLQKGQSSSQNHPNAASFATSPTFNQPALNLQLPAAPQLNNVNFNPAPQFNPHPESVQKVEFQIRDEPLPFNSLEHSCGPEPIIGQFKPELVDLSKGGPLTRMITTCGPDNACKSIALQSDLNRVLAVLPNNQNNFNRPPPQKGYQEQHIQTQGRGNYIYIDAKEPLIRPRNRRLIQYSEIPQDDAFN